MRELLVVGAGGHARELLWLASRCLSDDSRVRCAVEAGWEAPKRINELQVELLDQIEGHLMDVAYIIAIGNGEARSRVARRLDAAGAKAGILVDPSVLRSPSVSLQGGSVVCAGSILTCDVSIGRHVHVNTGCLIHHDVRIADFATLSPGVRVAGHVEIGARAFIGIGATIINGRLDHPLKIGDGAVVAGGACVINDVPAGALVAGVPAKVRL